MDMHTDNDGAALDNNDGVAAALSYPACLDLSLDEFKAAWKSSRRYVDRSTVQALKEAARARLDMSLDELIALGKPTQSGLHPRRRPPTLRELMSGKVSLGRDHHSRPSPPTLASIARHSSLARARGLASAGSASSWPTAGTWALGDVLGDEDRRHEFKRGNLLASCPRGRAKYEACVCGFANGGGGRLYLGVDNDGAVAGLSLSKRDRDALRLTHDGIVARTDPPLRGGLAGKWWLRAEGGVRQLSVVLKHEEQQRRKARQGRQWKRGRGRGTSSSSQSGAKQRGSERPAPDSPSDAGSDHGPRTRKRVVRRPPTVPEDALLG
ncbi:hypothetical protein EMIHUDRAFT_454883 [Emiliania huxleyi CCMP1516]|uniref:Schlafen AlbA-2 domain-containing protein n=2 Tax=Emiliania huxleyi TaxID=2903 RepID=A0A0D3KP62_EMIH1|nr:hypothetical protein EMIHUDRAFT_454883 [Emiliania huxleyi CCMP1516]EOD37547.1 hypothetical protein EMIHUDRAFT_454883 [Emiliania huxleyi CCMP1516]|eukprot:XP_005789976.1 hypothetical protein EMIHUDRAFT_454883 [Emiliania huxleyi CCMP1516]